MEPLDGIEVLDFTREVAGPHCTQLLGALGADVIKVESPSGERTRNEWVDAFSSFNLGKRSLSIDLKTEGGAETVRTLAAETDVIVENFRPGVLDQYELDYDSVSDVNDDVIYCSISGFGQEGPYRDRPAYDPIAQAMSGVMSQTGYPDQPPVRIGSSFIDCGTGIHAAMFIMGAVLERERSGNGRYIDTSLFDTAVSWMAYSIVNYSRTGKVSERSGSGNNATDTVYLAGDDRPFYVKAETQRQFEHLCEAINNEDLLTDDRFKSSDARAENDTLLREELETSFASFDRDELVDRLTEANVPIGPVQNIGEVVEDSHVEAREMLTKTRDLTTDTPLQTASLPLRTDEGQIEFGGQPPQQGEHNREILAELGHSDREIEDMYEQEVLHEDDH